LVKCVGLGAALLEVVKLLKVVAEVAFAEPLEAVFVRGMVQHAEDIS
jgi:hypothetical protein